MENGKLVVGLTRRHVIGSGSSSRPATDCNRNDTEDGDHKAALRQKKLKAKTMKWRSSNKDMNSKVEAGGSDRIYDDDTVLSSVTAASFNSLISKKRVRTLGKVAQQCDAIDPPVPRKLRSAINKRAGRIVPGSSRHVKKRRHLSAISAQISSVDQKTRFNESSLLTEEEEVADALLSLSKTPAICELTTDRTIADSSNINVSSNSYSEGAAKKGDRITLLPNTADELANQAACIVERTDSVPHVNPVPGSTNQSNDINSPLPENTQIQDLSLGVVANVPSPCKDSVNNSAQKQLKVQFDDSKSYTAQKPEASLWLVNPNKSDTLTHENGKAKNISAPDAVTLSEIVPRIQAPLPCTPDGPSSSRLAVQSNTISEFSKVTASGSHDKHSYLQLPLVKNTVPTKTWKRSMTHVYVSHVIQMHLNKEKASQNQAKPEERGHIHASRPPNSSIFHKSNAQDETCYAVQLDVRVPVQPSAGISDMSAGRQKIVSVTTSLRHLKMVGGNFLNLPTSTAVPGAQHVQYLHPQITPRGQMPYPFPHLVHSRANLTHAATLHQMQQYMCNPGYAPRPGLTANSSAMMKLQQLIPTQQQQQMWQFHVPQYQPRPDAAPPSGAAWHTMSSNLRQVPMLPPPAMPPQMELLCAPYQGGSRQPQQLRLM
ncbi:hypothetical protein EJB05_25434, partial [Eragrostis curvula]